jgi:membrane protein
MANKIIKITRKIEKNIKRLPLFFAKSIMRLLPVCGKIPLSKIDLFISSLYKGQLPQRAAAMTYQILMALIPMLLAVFSITSFFNEDIRTQLMDFIEILVPQYVWPAVSDIISGVIMNQSEMLFYLSFGTGIFFSTRMISSLLSYLNNTYLKTKKHSFHRNLLISFMLSLSAYALIILSVVVFAAVSYAVNWGNAHFFHSQIIYKYGILMFRWLFLFVMIYIFISALFYFAYADKKFFRFFSAGSAFSTGLFVILLYALKMYFQYFHNYNLLYGSLGALFAVLFCINWMCTVLLIGFELNVCFYHKDIPSEISSSIKNLFNQARAFLHKLNNKNTQ